MRCWSFALKVFGSD